MDKFSNDKILNSDISNLGLSYDSYEILKSINGIVKLEKIKDLASLNRMEILSILVDSGLSYDKISSVVEEVEKKLDSFGLSLGDARAVLLQNSKSIEEIEESKRIKIDSILNNKFLSDKLAKHGIVTLGDCENFYISDVKSWLSEKQKYDFIDIINALRENDLSFKQRESSIDFDDPKITYINVEDLTEEEAEEFYARPLSDLGFSKSAIAKLADNGINTIGEISMVYAFSLRNILNDNLALYHKVKERLAEFNVHVLYATDQVYYKSPKIQPKDISQMTLEEKQEFFSRPFSDIGVSSRVITLLAKRGMYTLGDVQSLTNTQFNKLLKGFTYIAKNKLLNTLAIFGIDKREEVYDKKYKPSTKEKPDFSNMDEKAKQLYYESSIDGMGFSDDLMVKFKLAGINTVGDLCKLSMKDIRILVNNAPSSQQRIREIFKDYGIEPVKFSTFFDGERINSFNFYAADEKTKETFVNSPITALGIYGVLVEKLKQEKLLTIDDLMNLTIKDLKTKFDVRPYTLSNLKQRLSEYGITLQYEDEKESLQLIEKADIPSMDSDEKAEFLAKSIDEFKLDKTVCKKLKKYGVDTIGELLKMDKSDIRKNIHLNSDTMQDIELLIANLGLRMKGSSCFVVDGKIVHKAEDINNIKYPKKVKAVDINLLSEEEKTKVLKTKLEDIGLHVRAVDLIHKKTDINTIGDIQSLYLGELNAILAQNPQYIEQTLSVLSEFGITFEPKLHTITKSEKSVNKLEECKSKEDILALELTDIGISNKIATRLKSDLGIRTVEDLTNFSKSELHYLNDGNAYYLANVCDKALKNIGLSLKEVKKKVPLSKVTVVENVDINTLSDDKIREFASRPLEEFGLAIKTTKILVEERGIKTIGEFLAISPTAVYSLLNGNDYLYSKTCERMKDFGIDMPDYKTVKRAKKQGGVPTVSRKQSDEEKYFMRKMAHYDSYLEYMDYKAHNKKQFKEDFEQK